MLDVPLEQELMTLDPYEVQQTALYSGPENPYNEKISFGNKNKNWNIVVCVRVTDCFGAFTFFCVKDRVCFYLFVLFGVWVALFGHYYIIIKLL